MFSCDFMAWKSSVTLTTIFMMYLYAFYSPTAMAAFGRGWGDHIEWKSFEEGLREAQNSRKPLMLVVHKSWCGACRALKPKFSTSGEIADLSNKFVMVNVEDEEEPKDKQFHIDGSYIPRIFFLDSFGKVQKDIINPKGNPSYKYFYSDAESIVASMKSSLDKMSSGIRVGGEL